MDRREFAAMMPAVLALSAALTKHAEAEASEPQEQPAAAAKPATSLPELTSGVYKPGPAKGASTERTSRRYLAGHLKAGDLQIEIHQTTQQAGALHEPVGTHLHNEIWLVRDGVCELTTNGVARRMEAGDVGLCAAGDTHFIRNAGDGPCSYFVVTVGPRETQG